jgi:hypothetical protein
LTIFYGAIFGMLAKSNCGRNLLKKYPGFFSGGTVSKGGVTKEMAEGTNFVMNLVGDFASSSITISFSVIVIVIQIGYGWREPRSGDASASADRATPPNRRVVVTVTGRNIGYGATCEYLVQSAAVVLREAHRMPGEGGVFTPGYAFQGTSLIER